MPTGDNCQFVCHVTTVCRLFNWVLQKHLATGCTGYQLSTSKQLRTLC